MTQEQHRLITGAAVVIATITVVLCLPILISRIDRLTEVSERGVVVAEKVEEHLAALRETMAPLGHAFVDKGVESLKEVDAKDLGKSATEGTKEAGRQALDALKRYLDEKSDKSSSNDP